MTDEMHGQNAPSVNQCRMAQVMGFHPWKPSTWPMDKINEMLEVERTQGFKEVYRRLDQMFRGPQ